MDIQAIGSRAFAVYIGEPELHRRHIEPRNVTVRTAKELVRNVLDCPDTGTVSLELFPGRHELLIFVRRSAGEPEFYEFTDLEAALSALAVLPRGCDASLYYLRGVYILAVWPGDGARIQALCEFGRPVKRPPAYLLHLREHAAVIADGDAAETLGRYFFPAAGS